VQSDFELFVFGLIGSLSHSPLNQNTNIKAKKITILLAALVFSGGAYWVYQNSLSPAATDTKTSESRTTKSSRNRVASGVPPQASPSTDPVSLGGAKTATAYVDVNWAKKYPVAAAHLTAD
jgi:zona occludens toxin (predicted ATPase)